MSQGEFVQYKQLTAVNPSGKPGEVEAVVELDREPNGKWKKQFRSCCQAAVFCPPMAIEGKEIRFAVGTQRLANRLEVLRTVIARTNKAIDWKEPAPGEGSKAVVEARKCEEIFKDLKGQGF